MSLPNRKVVYWLIVLGLFLVQGTIFYWIVPGAWADRIAPNPVLIAVIFSALFVHRYFAMALGMAFGLLHDVMYYGHMLGLYTFVMGLTGYLIGVTFPRKHMPFYYVMLAVGIGLLVFDSLIYLLYRLFQVVTAAYDWALLTTILPSALFNLFLTAALYIPLRQYAEKMTPAEQPEEG